MLSDNESRRKDTKKSRKYKEDEVESRSTEGAKSKKSKEKKKKKNTTDADTDEMSIAVETEPDKGKEKKKKKKRKQHDEDPDDPVVSKKKRRKENSSLATPHDPNDDHQLHVNDLQGTNKKGKKKKKDKAPTGDLEMTAVISSTPDFVEDKDLRNRVKKDKSTKTDSHKDKANTNLRRVQQVPQEALRRNFPDPSSDASLSDKSRNALSYVRTRLVNPSEWKFNKALQNWIVRHLWSPSDIPSTYFGLVVSYLADSKGGVREHLLQDCEKHAQEGKVQHPNDTEQASEVTITPPVTQDRAQQLLLALNKCTPTSPS